MAENENEDVRLRGPSPSPNGRFEGRPRPMLSGAFVFFDVVCACADVVEAVEALTVAVAVDEAAAPAARCV